MDRCIYMSCTTKHSVPMQQYQQPAVASCRGLTLSGRSALGREPPGMQVCQAPQGIPLVPAEERPLLGTPQPQTSSRLGYK